MDPAQRYSVLRLAEAETVDKQAVLEFWEREGALQPRTARERIEQVAFIALDERGELAATSTIGMLWSSQLRAEMWNFRTFVGRDHRRSLLAILLMRRNRQYHEQRFVSGVDTSAPGIMLELQNPEVKQHRTEAIWEHPGSPGKRWVFIGENELGDHVRVYYFPGAHAPPAP